MSYDVSVVDRTRSGVDWVVFDSNITTNLKPMWIAAGLDLKKLDGMKGRDASVIIRAAMVKMREEPEVYKEMEDKNGWGTYDQGMNFLSDLWRACKINWAGVVKVEW